MTDYQRFLRAWDGEMCVSTYLPLGHNIQVELIDREIHVPKYGAPIFEHRDHLILDPTMGGTISSDLQGNQIALSTDIQLPHVLSASTWKGSLQKTVATPSGHCSGKKSYLN